MADNGEGTKGTGFRKFATPRIIGGVGIAVVVLWALTLIFGSSEAPQGVADKTPMADRSVAVPATTDTHAATPAPGQPALPSGPTTTTGQVGTEMHTTAADPETTTGHGGPVTHGVDTAHDAATQRDAGADHEFDTHAAPAGSTHVAAAPQEPSHNQPAAQGAPGAPTAGHDTGGHTPATLEPTDGHPLPDTNLHKPTPKASPLSKPPSNPCITSWKNAGGVGGAMT